MDRKPVLMSLGAILSAAIAPKHADAQCVFQKAEKAKTLKASIVQAYVPCNVPNTTTEGGVPSCTPPQSFTQQNGNPPSGWKWGPHSTGSIQIKAISGKTLADPNDPLNAGAPDISDLSIRVSLRGVVRADNTGPVNASGMLNMLSRTTMDDRVNGDQTIIDYPVNFPILVANGKANMKTSFGTRLNQVGQPSYPRCVNSEIVSMNVVDANSDVFGVIGVACW